MDKKYRVSQKKCPLVRKVPLLLTDIFLTHPVACSVKTSEIEINSAKNIMSLHNFLAKSMLLPKIMKFLLAYSFHSIIEVFNKMAFLILVKLSSE